MITFECHISVQLKNVKSAILWILKLKMEENYENLGFAFNSWKQNLWVKRKKKVEKINEVHEDDNDN